MVIASNFVAGSFKSFNCDWFIIFNRRFDYKLIDCMIGSQLVENTWPFKPITFDESVRFMIRCIICKTHSFDSQAILIVLCPNFVLLTSAHSSEWLIIKIIMIIIIIIIFTQEAPFTRKWFSGRSCTWSHRNLEMVIFEERGKPENPEKNLSQTLIMKWNDVIRFRSLHVSKSWWLCEPAVVFTAAGILNLSNCICVILFRTPRDGGPFVIVK